jgi:GGDEF domain-containing protein/EAL domain-containing protein (putative c-di-GMP-specific phosphodiesterase class I)
MLEAIIERRDLRVRYRPVVNLAGGEIEAHVARVALPLSYPARDVEHLFRFARQQDLLIKFGKRYFDALFAGYARAQVKAPLLAPVPGGLLDQGEDICLAILAKSLKRAGLSSQQVVFLFQEIECAEPGTDRLRHSLLRRVSNLGLNLAVAGIGPIAEDLALDSPGRSLFHVLDEDMLDEGHDDEQEWEAMRRWVAELSARGGRLVLPRVDNAQRLLRARELAVDLGMGDLFGKPAAQPHEDLSLHVLRLIRRPTARVASAGRTEDGLLARLMVRHEPVHPDTPVIDVMRLFELTPELFSVAVVEDERPLGLISRHDMTDNLARPYRVELYGRKSCVRFMDSDPLILEVSFNLKALMEQVVTAHPRHLMSGFIVTESGRFLGMGSVQDLMREITHLQLAAARHANPLTELPGNVPINRHIDNLLDHRIPFAVAYCDLDHFKPFNDVHGYARGDEIILLTAAVLREIIDPDIDFLGHVGGDDFVLVLRSSDWEARCRRALENFGRRVLGFFSREEIEKGGYCGENRSGEHAFHRITSLSIGALTAVPGEYANHLEVASVAAEVKHMAKSIAGNSLYVNQRRPLASAS